MPGQFSPIFGELIYTYQGAGEGQVFDAEIYGGSPLTLLGIKRFTGAERIGVNVSGYLRRKLSPCPIESSGSGFYNGGGRTVRCVVKHDKKSTPVRIFTAGLRNLFAGELLTMMPLHRNIGRDEKDELSFVTEGGSYAASFEVKGGGNISFSTNTSAVPEGVCTFVTDMGRVMSEVAVRGGSPSSCRAVHVRIFGDGSELAHIIYAIKDNPENAVRLCWLNSTGGIDHFTFQTVVSRQVISSKKKIISRQGYTTVSSASETVMELNSGYQPVVVLEGLSEIVASSRVWICRGEGFVAADIISENVPVHGDTLTCMRLKIRESKVVNFQTF